MRLSVDIPASEEIVQTIANIVFFPIHQSAVYSSACQHCTRKAQEEGAQPADISIKDHELSSFDLRVLDQVFIDCVSL